jgi:hypothetical protein
LNETTLTTAQLLLTTASLIVIGISWYRASKARGAYEERTIRDIESLKISVERIEHIERMTRLETMHEKDG